MRKLAAAAWMAAIATGCFGGQSGSPPSGAPVIEPTLVTAEPTPTRGESLDLIGAPGSISPTTAEVWVLNLDRSAMGFRVVAVDADGGFAAVGAGRAGDAVRVQARDAESGRGAPLDVRLGDVGAPPVALEHPLACLHLDATEEMTVAAGPVSVTLTNDCSVPVDVDASMALSTAGFTLVSAPATVAVGASATVTLTVSADAVGAEDVLLLRLEPAPDLRAITLVAGD